MSGALLEVDATDDALVVAARAGDADAFRRLVDRHRDWLTARCRRHLGGDVHAAEDLAQECLLALQRTIVTKDAPLRVRPWLTVVARNRCIDESRKRRAVPTATVPDGVVFDPEVGEGDELLVRAWGALNGRHRRVLELRELSGLSYEEIAASLALTSGAVEALLFRARSALRREYARAGGKVAAMAPMQEAVARASGQRGVLTAMVDRGAALVDGAPGRVGSASLLLGGGGVDAASSASVSTSGAASSSAESGFRLLQELQARLLGLPGIDGVLGGSAGGRLRAALAAAAMLLGSASVVAGTVVSAPDSSAGAGGASSSTPPASVVLPQAPPAATPGPPATPDAPAPAAPSTPAPPAPSSPSAPAAPSAGAEVTAPVTVPTTLLPEGLVSVTVPPVSLPPLSLPPVPVPVPPAAADAAAAAQFEAILGQLLTGPR